MSRIKNVVAQLNETTYTAYLLGHVPTVRKIITRVLRKQFKIKYLEYIKRGEYGNLDPMLQWHAPPGNWEKYKDAIDAEAEKEGWDELGYDMYGD
jgi:hypothetical protein